MPKIAFEILPPDGHWDELPAKAQFDPSPDWGELKPIDLQWREAWIEAFLARHKHAIAECLGDADTSLTVFRQLADMDLVFADSTHQVVTLVELKKQKGSHAKDAVCQLARNFAKARRVVRETYPDCSIRAVACGAWADGQLRRARETLAWEYLQNEQATPTFVVYCGAVSSLGREYFVLNEGASPFPRKGKTVPDERFAQLQLLTRQISKRLPSGLDVVAYRIGQRAVIRFTADSKLRSLYLQSRIGSTHYGSLAAFFRVEAALVARPDVVAQRSIGQRLELFLQPRFTDSNIPAEHAVLHSLLAEIEKLTTDAGSDRRPNKSLDRSGG